MGAKNSRLPSPRREQGGTTGPSDSCNSRPTPFIEAPYTGPWAEYQFVDVTVPVVSDVTFTSDVTMASTKSSSVVAALEDVYGNGYSLVTLCRLPGSPSTAHRQVFVPGREVQYQGIFCRYEGDPGNEGWNLKAEKSLLLAHQVTPGVVSAEAGPGAQHVQQLISGTVQTGGRLLTVQWSGQQSQTSAEAPLGVDVFFEVPDQSIPERSVYQLVTAPAAVVKRSLFASKGHVTCDWTGILTRHLARGWRLVDVFCEFPSAGALPTALSSGGTKIQTVWFFEKPESRARDDSAVYEGTIVEHWVDASSSSSSPSPPLMTSGAASCLGGGRGELKRSGGSGGKKSFTKRMASLRKKPDDVVQGESDDKQNDDVTTRTDDEKQAGASQPEHAPTTSEVRSENADRQDKNHVTGSPRQTIPSRKQTLTETAGWESVIRSMGEKGWELASVINSMDSQVVAGRSKVKVLLVFQRKISLVLTVKGRRTSDGLALRADTGASTSAMCDIPMMTGETASHLNPSLAVRLPLSRSTSRDHDDFNASCDDDIPSTIGGSCGRTLSATDLSITGRGLESAFLEPGRSFGRGREESLLQPKGSIGDEGSIGTAGRSSTSSQHSRVTAAEVHITSGGEGSSGEEKPAELSNDSASPKTDLSRDTTHRDNTSPQASVPLPDPTEGSATAKSESPGSESLPKPLQSLHRNDVTSSSGPETQQQENQNTEGESKNTAEDETERMASDAEQIAEGQSEHLAEELQQSAEGQTEHTEGREETADAPVNAEKIQPSASSSEDNTPTDATAKDISTDGAQQKAEPPGDE